jgi:hypothetical protein
MLKKVIKTVLIVALVALIGIQFISAEKNSGGYESIEAFESETKPSTQVAALLKENCYDCHSNQTQYPWYSNIAPFSYWQEEHIEHGKHHFNASEWSGLPLKKKEHKLEEVGEMLEKEEMPLKSYTFLHGNISQEERALIMQWASMARLQYQQQMEVSGK